MATESAPGWTASSGARLAAVTVARRHADPLPPANSVKLQPDQDMGSRPVADMAASETEAGAGPHGMGKEGGARADTGPERIQAERGGGSRRTAAPRTRAPAAPTGRGEVGCPPPPPQLAKRDGVSSGRLQKARAERVDSSLGEGAGGEGGSQTFPHAPDHRVGPEKGEVLLTPHLLHVELPELLLGYIPCPSPRPPAPPTVLAFPSHPILVGDLARQQKRHASHRYTRRGESPFEGRGQSTEKGQRVTVWAIPLRLSCPRRTLAHNAAAQCTCGE